ncbi:ribonuclease P protein component [Patescibacteria group bacterium]|nr:ribonuclease P protein component [Patescibacteria group bacterium]MBU1922110.1 ribonuclease P protein component [Patescibacteria group bacterium]
MLKPKYRLKAKTDFENVRKRGRGASVGKIAVKSAKNGLEYSRFAFVVSLKISKSAVKRNRLRRQMREIIRLNLNKIKPGYDIVIRTRPGSLDLDFEGLKSALARVFEKLGLI